MRICLISLDYKPYRSSGLTIYAEDLATGLVELGHEISVIAAKRPGLPVQHQVDKVEVYRAGIDGLDWITYGWRAANLLEQLQQKKSFDVVHFLDLHFAYHYRGPFIASVWQSFRQSHRLPAAANAGVPMAAKLTGLRPLTNGRFGLLTRPKRVIL